MKHRFQLLVTIVLAGSLLLGCKSKEPSRNQPALNVLVFVDQSDSISAGQRQKWLAEARTILKRFRAGVFFAVYGIHDHTGEAAPRTVVIPELPENALPEQYGVWEIAIKNAMTYLTEALNTDSPSRATDIFSAFDRCAAVAQERPTKIVIFSDMLHVTKDMNMEKQLLHDQDFPRIISRLAEQHRWSNDSLRHAPVFVVLPSVEKTSLNQVASPRAVNDRLVLRRFYETLISTLGGKLSLFDTDLKPGGIQ